MGAVFLTLAIGVNGYTTEFQCQKDGETEQEGGMTSLETVQWKAKGSKKDCSLLMNLPPGELAFQLIDLPDSENEDCEKAYLQFEFLNKNYDDDSRTLIRTSKKFC